MKIALSQLNYTVGDFETNTEKVKNTILASKESGIDLLVFSELAIGGYPAFDLYTHAFFCEGNVRAIDAIKKHCVGIACLIGGVYAQNGQLFNAVYWLEEGEVKEVITKKQLSSEDWCDERRYFTSGKGAQLLRIQNKNIILAIGEDIQGIPGENKEGDLVIHLNAQAFSYLAHADKLRSLQTLSAKLALPLLEVNTVGGQGDMLFEGNSVLMSARGKVLEEWNAFQEETKAFTLGLEGEMGRRISEIENVEPSEIALIHNALVMGIRDFFVKQGFEKAVLGLSGGLDSALVAALACEALGAENVLAILLPSVHSTAHSLKDALDLVANTGCHHEIIPIKEMVLSVDALLEPVFKGRKSDLTEENIQARCRGLILMAISNKLGHIVLNTSNKSECAVGYGTLYGDMVGALSVIGDVYKTQAFELAKYINREREVIPVHTIVKPPSAELRPDQKDSDSLPDYPVLDAILFEHVDQGKNATEIIAMGYQQELVERTLRLVKNAEFKRYQAPPILRISNKAFGRARILPVVYK